MCLPDVSDVEEKYPLVLSTNGSMIDHFLSACSDEELKSLSEVFFTLKSFSTQRADALALLSAAVQREGKSLEIKCAYSFNSITNSVDIVYRLNMNGYELFNSRRFYAETIVPLKDEVVDEHGSIQNLCRRFISNVQDYLYIEIPVKKEAPLKLAFASKPHQDEASGQRYTSYRFDTLCKPRFLEDASQPIKEEKASRAQDEEYSRRAEEVSSYYGHSNVTVERQNRQKVYAAALAAAHKNDKLHKLRSHELNALLAYVRDSDADLAKKIEAILIERKQSFVIMDRRASQLARQFNFDKIADQLEKAEFLKSLTYSEVAQINERLVEERNRLRSIATCEDPNEEDVAKYLDVIQVCKKVDKLFSKTDPPLKSGDAAKNDGGTDEGVAHEAHAKALAEYMYSVKVANQGSPMEILSGAAQKCGLDISLYQKHSAEEICELRVAGVIIKANKSVTLRDAFLKCVLESLQNHDFLKIVANKEAKVLSLSKQSSDGHIRYDKLCGPRLVLRE